MNYFNGFNRTAIFTMAVLVCGLMLVGCFATQRDAQEIKAKLDRVEASQTRTDEAVSKMESVVIEGAESGNQLRADMRLTIDDLSQQLGVLTENYNELLQMMNRLLTQKITTVILPSPGASDQQTHIDQRGRPVKPVKPVLNCDSTYDESFIQIRRSEYDQAAAGFDLFITTCADHPDVANAHYWRGECFYLQQKYDEAIKQYQQIVDNFKNSPKLSQAIYKVARSKEEQGKTAEAKVLFQLLVDDHIGTLEAEQAKARLKEL